MIKSELSVELQNQLLICCPWNLIVQNRFTKYINFLFPFLSTFSLYLSLSISVSVYVSLLFLSSLNPHTFSSLYLSLSLSSLCLSLSSSPLSFSPYSLLSPLSLLFLSVSSSFPLSPLSPLTLSSLSPSPPHLTEPRGGSCVAVMVAWSLRSHTTWQGVQGCATTCQT